MDEASNPTPIRRLGKRFELLARLGQGGMGIVYEARDMRENAIVALKTLPELDADALLRFKNEFRALADIHHPNLVSLHELFEESGEWFFTMERVHGQDFLRYIRGVGGESTDADGGLRGGHAEPGDAEPTRSAPAAHAATRAPSSRRVDKAAHEAPPAPATVPTLAGDRLDARGMDVRRGAPAERAHGARRGAQRAARGEQGAPGHQAVERAGQRRGAREDPRLWAGARSGDRAVRAGDSEVDRTIVGTPTFMAPEQMLGGSVGPAADWYSVGVILYLALTGTPPHSGSSSCSRS